MTDDSDRNGRRMEALSTIGSSLLQRIKAFDNAAWNEMVTKFYPLVYAWCRKAGLGEHDAADVCQDTFRSVATSIANFRRSESCDTFGGWLRRITQRRIIDHRKKANEAIPATGGTDARAALDMIADLSTSSQGTTTSRDSGLQKVLESVKQEFEDLSWKAFIMTTVEELSPSEVASLLGVSRNAVYLAKSRILKRVREMLSDYEKGMSSEHG